MVNGVVEEEHFARLNEESHERQKAVCDQPVDGDREDADQPHDDRSECEESNDHQDRPQNTEREVVDHHFQTGFDAVGKHRVNFLQTPCRERTHDHGAGKHVDFRAKNDAHCRESTDDTAAPSVNVASSGVGDQSRHQILHGRSDKLVQCFIRQPAGRNKERCKNTPSNENTDIGHDFRTEEGTEFLDSYFARRVG